MSRTDNVDVSPNMQDATRTLSLADPDYDRPPVVETIVGVQFKQLPQFKNAHLGAFWKEALGPNDWPHVADAPPLPPQFERFAGGAQWAKGVHLQLTQDPSTRSQITNKDGDRMIQVQNGAIHSNWLGRAGGPYPHYSNVREGFTSALRRFMEFIAAEKLGDFRPDQWEVTYVNHILKGTVWNAPSDWGFFLPLRGVPTIDGLIQGESFSGGWHFVIPDQRGRLHVQWQHGRKSEPEEQETIVLTLTARGPLVEGPDVMQAISDGLNLGHKTIIHSFRTLMDDSANDYWGLKHGSD